MSQLSDTDKAHLFLLESLESVDDGDIDEAWRTDAEARLDAIERGEARTVPADDVFAKLSRRFRPHIRATTRTKI